MTPPAPDNPHDPCAKAGALVTCQQCADFLLDYIDGVLPEDQRFRFDSHLALCPDCVTFVENYRKAAALAEAAGRTGADRADPSVPEELVQAILKARDKKA
jgi:anti-sigma factor RsiW